MLIEQTGMEGLLLVTPEAIADERGFFMEAFRQDVLEKSGVNAVFVQDNLVRSEAAGIVRGLHFQRPPAAQAKFIGVLRGAIFDVAVDLRKGKPSFGQWKSFILSAENNRRLFIPRGFAHGYMTLEAQTEVMYKTDAYYAPKHDAGIFWKDPLLKINWPDLPPVLSNKDANLQRLSDFISPF
ncbi:MAG: dTDP-4-dehydrorhamnose 3,5-epimerase [Deltaproteobacteria bacterium]|jgi:dTDP-4-dehydrorhamnose 3,5-epimerase|nr:dTDP-4-dehydrorhamnose 3,5-epimerase [Deltaproteobacteria bacterium]